MKKLIRIATGLIVAHLAGAAMAQQDSSAASTDDSKLYWQLSPYTLHFSPSEEHRNVYMIGVERMHASGKLDGFTVFTNSFGQPSVFIYPWGKIYHGIWGIEPLSFKWTAGLLYGYVDPYENKVPLNHKGFSPGAIIALAYEFKPGWSAQVDMLGTAGLMFQLNLPFR
jgi:hypothetical protein